MDGIHDLGGVEGFGPLPIENGDKDFRNLEDWEKRMFALNWSPIVPGGTIDWFRHGIERMVPADYLNFSYFEKWCANAFMQMIDNGSITMDDVKRGHVEDPVSPPAAMSLEDALEDMSASDFSFELEASSPPAFTVGSSVITKRKITSNHTRLPRYVGGLEGEIIAHHGAHVLPDRSAEGAETPEHLYTVVFRATTLWGENANPRDDVTLDLWESYLVPA